jgi:hypothetical protein
MRLHAECITESGLVELGKEAVRLLATGDLNSLASQFGYALAFGRDPCEAIQADLIQSLAEVNATSVGSTIPHPEPSVRFLQGATAGVVGVIECQVKTNTGSEILLELVLSVKGNEKHLTLEQISAAA